MITKKQYEEYQRLIKEYELQRFQMAQDAKKIQEAKELFKDTGWRSAEKMTITMSWTQSTGADGNGRPHEETETYEVEQVGLLKNLMQNYVQHLQEQFKAKYGKDYWDTINADGR